MPAASGSYSITGSAAGLVLVIGIDIASYNLTGTAATLSRSGSPTLGADSGSYSISDGGTFLEANLFMGTGDYVVTGTAASLNRGKGVPASTTLYSIAAGPAVSLRATRTFTLDTGTYAVGGGDANLVHSSQIAKIIIAAGGSYAITGSEASTRNGPGLICESGSYSTSGQSAALAIILTATSGSYVLTGTAAATLRASLLMADVDSYTITANDALLDLAERLGGDSGAYLIAGLDTFIGAQRHLDTAIGDRHYTLTGTDVFLRSTRLSVDSGSYTLTGGVTAVTSNHAQRWQKLPRRSPGGKKQLAIASAWNTQQREPGITA
jgi:hypothetical protein